MTKLLISPPIDAGLLEVVRTVSSDVDVVVAEDKEEALREIQEAEVFFGLFDQDLLSAGKRLRWIQVTSAGLDKLLFPELVESHVVLTNASGVYGIHIAEHVFALLLGLSRGIHKSVRYQLARKWERPPEFIDVWGKTFGILGLGGIGLQVAKRAKAFDMRTLAVDIKRTEKPDTVNELWKPERLGDLLEQSDFVLVSVPYTPKTDQMIGKAAFKQMKPTALIINVARGKIIDQHALIEALKAGEIAGAGLDVFEEEPLLTDSELWEMENVIITPHGAGGSPLRNRRMVTLFAENLRRYTAEEPLLNVVDKRLGY